MPSISSFSETGPPQNLGEILTRNAEAYPHDVAVIHGGSTFTWSGLNARVNRLANGLLTLGISHGDRVAFLLQNNHHWIEVSFAALRIGAVVVSLDLQPEAGAVLVGVAAGITAGIPTAGLLLGVLSRRQQAAQPPPEPAQVEAPTVIVFEPSAWPAATLPTPAGYLLEVE